MPLCECSNSPLSSARSCIACKTSFDLYAWFYGSWEPREGARRNIFFPGLKSLSPPSLSSLSLSLSVCLCHSVAQIYSLCPSQPLSVSLCVSVSACLCLSPSPLCLSVSLSLSFSRSDLFTTHLSLSVCLSVSLSLCFSVCVCLSLSLSVCVCLSLSVSLTLSLVNSSFPHGRGLDVKRPRVFSTTLVK